MLEASETNKKIEISLEGIPNRLENKFSSKEKVDLLEKKNGQVG